MGRRDATERETKGTEETDKRRKKNSSGNGEEEEAVAPRLCRRLSAKSAAPAALFLLRRISIALHTIAILQGA